MKKYAILFSITLLLAACSSGKEKADKQEQQWQTQLNALSLGANGDQVQQWAKHHHIVLHKQSMPDGKKPYFARQDFKAD